MSFSRRATDDQSSDSNHQAARRLLGQDTSAASDESRSSSVHADHAPMLSQHDLIVKKGDPELDTFQRLVGKDKGRVGGHGLRGHRA
jgi:hypothetical protein